MKLQINYRNSNNLVFILKSYMYKLSLMIKRKRPEIRLISTVLSQTKLDQARKFSINFSNYLSKNSSHLGIPLSFTCTFLCAQHMGKAKIFCLRRDPGTPLEIKIYSMHAQASIQTLITYKSAFLTFQSVLLVRV